MGVIIHEFALSEVAGISTSPVELLLQVYDFICHRDGGMIDVVSHWNHGTCGQSITEAPRADLAIYVVKEAFVNQFLFEYVWISFEDFTEHSPLVTKLHSVLFHLVGEPRVLTSPDLEVRPHARELDSRHLEEIRIPIGVLSAGNLIEKE